MRLRSMPVGMLLVVVLSSCAADGGAGTEGSPLWFMRTSETQRVAYYHSICLGYGFKDDTPQMSQCLQTEAISAKSSARLRMAIIAADD